MLDMHEVISSTLIVSTMKRQASACRFFVIKRQLHVYGIAPRMVDNKYNDLKYDEATMLVSTIQEKDLTVDLIDRLLFKGLEDTGEHADCMIVLGSAKATTYRIPVAVNAYHAGRTRKLILCGGTLREYPIGTCSEAEYMSRVAQEHGVAKEDIILETSSQNTIENILFAMVELQRAFWLNHIHSVLLVTTAYHMRRSLAIARYLFPNHIAVIPCPANDNNTKRDNWMNTQDSIDRAKGEVRNLLRCVANGVIPDFELP